MRGENGPVNLQAEGHERGGRVLGTGRAAYPLSVVGYLLVLGILGGTAVAAASEVKVLERSGDAHRARAVPHYTRAFEIWESIHDAARRVSEFRAAEASRKARASLSVRLIDPRLFESLRIGDRIQPEPLTATAAGDGGSVEPLERLAQVLAVARRAYARVPEGEERDLLLIEEAQALVHHSIADRHQYRADALYRRALALVPPSTRTDPDSAATAARLSLKLRDFDAAWRIGEVLAAATDRLPPDSEVAHLRVLRTAARFLHKPDRALALRDQIVTKTGKAEEPPAVDGRLAGFPVGTRADLVATVTAFVGLASTFRLPPRDTALAVYFGALAALELGEYALAEELLRGRAEGVEDDPWFRSAILSRLAYARLRLGDYEGALRASRLAEAALSGVENTEAFAARVRLNAAQAQLGLGKLAEVAEVARATARADGLPADVRLRARLLGGAALYEWSREEPERLADARRAFLAAERELGDTSKKIARRTELEIVVGIHLGNVFRREAMAREASGSVEGAEPAQKLRRAAIERQDRAMRTASRAGLHGLAATAAANLGELYLESGNPKAASSFVRWGLDRAREEKQFETEWRCHWYLARIAVASGSDPDADREYARAVDIVESYRARILDAETKSGFMSNKLDLFQDLVGRELSRGRPARALEFAERGRARALVESLGWRFLTLSSPRDTALYREYVSLMAREARWRRTGAARYLGVRASAVDYDSLRARLEKLRGEIRASPEVHPATRVLLDGAPLNARDIRQRLGAGRVLLSYFSLGDSLVAFIVDAEEVQAVRLGISESELSLEVRRLTDRLAAGETDEDLSRALYARILAPLAPFLRERRLVIAPYGPLHRLPFEVLEDAGVRAIERWEISYLPSASLLGAVGEESGSSAPPAQPGSRAAPVPAPLGGALLALLDPDTDYDGDGTRDMAALVHARSELASFAPSFEKPAVLSGGDATEGALYRLARGREVLHFACHGEFYPTRPWDSTLFLARGEGGDADDGRLRAFEVYGLDLRGNRLVTLSGCETGRSEVTRADDPVGIGTAFLHAGASSLLVSLWKVEDAATAALMRSFYTRWVKERKDSSVALREAKLELARGPFPNPRQWAAFVLIGGI